MSCSCEGANHDRDPFAGKVLGCGEIQTTQVVVPVASVTERVNVFGLQRNRRSATVVNAGTVLIYVGGPHVSQATGFPLAAGAGLTLDLAGELWACTASAAVAEGSIACVFEIEIPGCQR